ncbi:MAG: hypothetical protein E6767_19025 [Dysgonomonas sp.]|nr:hypothetical protein [Dysgonomonas sp.]
MSIFDWFKKQNQYNPDEIEDELVRIYYKQYQEQYPNISHKARLGMAQKKAEWERDTEKITKEQIREVLVYVVKEFDLPDKLLEIYDSGQYMPFREYGFYNVFSCPEEVFLMTKKEMDEYNVDRYVPLFVTSDDFGVILAYDNIKHGFVKYYPELPQDEYPVYTWDGVFISEVMAWYEDEKEDEDIIKMGTILGIKKIREILETIKKYESESYPYNEREKSIIKKYNLEINKQ